MKSIFVSRSLAKDSPFFELSRELDFSVIDTALIHTVKIPFSYTPQANWIFFTSKNAIRYFFSQTPDLPQDVKYGVISPSSGNTLKEYDKQADFIGEGIDLVNISKKFREVLQSDSVLFPQAMDSLRTIQKQLAFTNTVYNLYTYKTMLRTDFELPYTDALVFTSPSNVKAYFSKYRPDARQLIVAMGASTKYKLTEYGFKDVLVPEAFSEKGLADTVAAQFKMH